MIEYIMTAYVLIGMIISLAQMYINDHLYGDFSVWNYFRLLLLWPLVVAGIYR